MIINNYYLSYYKMREMENMPRDNYKKKNILVDEEPQDSNINQIGNKITNDIALNIKNMDEIPENSNYLISSFNQNKIPNIVLLFGLLILIISEIIFKDSLFKYSLIYEKHLQNSLSKGSLKLFEIISITGDGVFIGIILCFIFCYFTLIKTILICTGLIFIVYLHDLMKLIYSDPRPFWVDSLLLKGKCETSYGNPSGHSLISFYFYLSFCYYLCQIHKIKNNIYLRVCIYIIALLISSLTAFSRLTLGVHSLDQVLFGSFLGIFAFLIIAFMFKIYDMPLNHYLKFYKIKNYIITFVITNILLLIFPFIIYSFIDVEKDKKKYESVMNKYCPNIEEYQLYSHNCLAESLIILLILGIYCGQFIFWYLISKTNNKLIEDNSNKNDDYLILEESINHWNIQLNKIIKDVMISVKFLCILFMILIPGIFYLIISGENSLGNIFIFKIGLPLFLIGFLAFGPCFYGLIHILKE